MNYSLTKEQSIDCLKDLWNEVYNEDSDGYDYAEAIDMAIEALQDRPSGEWTYLHGSIGSYMTISCPFCGTTFNDVAEWNYNYCPSCGAIMKGGDDE
jgi:rubrerythrin